MRGVGPTAPRTAWWGFLVALRALEAWSDAPGFAQEVRINDYIAYDQGGGEAATGGTSLRFVWSDWSTSYCAERTIVTREWSLSGTPITGDNLAQGTCLGTDNFDYAAVGALPSGVFLVVRVGSQFNDVLGQVFDAASNPVGSELTFRAPSSTLADTPVALAHPNGTFVAAWSTDDGNAYGRVVLPDGSFGGPEVALRQVITPGNPGCKMAAFDSGEIVAVWRSVVTFPRWGDVAERRFDASLNALGPETAVNQTLVWLGGLAVAARGADYLVAWDSGPADSNVYARRMNQVTGPLGDQFMVNDYTAGPQGGALCAIDAQGGAVIVWGSEMQDGYNYGVFARRLDPKGNKVGSEFQVNMKSWGDQGSNGIAMLPSGDFVVGFGSPDTVSYEFDVFMRRFFFPVSLLLAPGPGSGNPPRTETRRPDGSSGTASFLPYGSGGFGATVGSGNINGGTTWELLTGPGPSASFGPQVRAFRPNGTSIAKVDFYAYGTLKYGVKEGGAGLDADAYSEILTTPGPGAVFGPHVRGWNFDNATLAAMSKVSFYAFGTLKYGANASRGNVDGDAYDEILAAPGPGAAFGAQVRGFNYDDAAITSMPKVNLFAFSPGFFGATVASADLESDGDGAYGDGYDEIVAGRGPDPSAAADFRIFDYDNASILRKYEVAPAYTTFKYGVNVAGGDVDAGDTEEIATAPGPDPAAPSRILCFEWNPVVGYNPDGPLLLTIGTDDFVAFGSPQLPNGANVAVGVFE